ncbi:MAG: MATE family efflux transporter [Candidatus Eremiobacteraeota bacterium]|nr:MATE family efflux transporter [Candidatus Eremiobacteraeota bacterium]MBV8643864.1 MATE family efflux transporter [Candidatus Eremiobacteraeota bacterium]
MQQRRLALDDSRPIWQAMLVFLLPLMLSNVLQSASATLNSIYLGRLIGVQALAAASSFFPIVFFTISFFVGIANASTVLIGQAYGARNEERLKAVAGTTLSLALSLGIIVAIVTWIFMPQLLHLIGCPPDIFDQSLPYARVTFASFPLIFVYFAYVTFIRGTGDARTPLLALIVSVALILLVTPALIRGWFGLPQLGILSAAYAGIAANFVAWMFLLVALRLEKNPLALDMSIVRHMWPERQLLATIFRLGIPSGIQIAMVSLAEIAVISLVNRFGSSATAAYGAVNQIVSYVQFPAISIGIAASIFGAQSIGAKRVDRLMTIARAAVALNWSVGAVLIALVYLFDRAILSLFITDPQVVETAHELLVITLWSYLLFGTSASLSGVMRSSGAVLWPTLLSVISIWGVEVPVAYALAPHYGLRGVWTAYPIAFACGVAFQLIYFFGFWRRKKFTSLIAEPPPPSPPTERAAEPLTT